MRALVAAVAATAVLLLAAVLVPTLLPSRSVPHADASPVRLPSGPTYVPIRAERVLDTVHGIGHRGRLTGGRMVAVHLAGVPIEASSAALEVSVVQPSARGTLTLSAGPRTGTAPAAVDYSAGATTTTLVQTQVGAYASLTLGASAGTVDVRAYLVGYYAGPSTRGAKYVPVTRARPHAGAVRRGAAMAVPVSGADGVPASGVAAIALDVAVDHATTAGTLLAGSDATSTDVPVASFAPGRPTTQLAYVRPGPGGQVTLAATAGAVDVQAMVVGYFAVSPAPPEAGTYAVANTTPVALAAPAGATLQLPVAGTTTVPWLDVTTVALQLTVQATGHVAVAAYPPDGPPPALPQVTAIAGVATTQLLLVPPGRDGRIRLDVTGAGTVKLNVQVTGYMKQTDWVVLENARAGTDSWRLPDGRSSSAIEGYADHASIDPGDPLRLFVRSHRPWSVRAFRLGWYGGAGARLVWKSAEQPARWQPPAITTSDTRTVWAPWHGSLTATTTGWPPGIYLLQLRTANGDVSQLPLVVRSPSVVDRTVLVTSDLTLQAYNRWGGRSLYLGPDRSAKTRSYAVSFDRPYDPNSAYRFLETQQPLVFEAERLGLPLAYLSDVDVARGAASLLGARTVVVGGHAEYWTWSERAAVTAARDHGSNLLFFGANQMWWQVRLEATDLGPDRLETGYKTDAGLDPMLRRDPELVTTHFRTLHRPMPESRIIGVQYACIRPHAAFVVLTPGFFAFRGTGARAGSRYPGLVGPEIDHANPGPDSPPGMQVVAHSPARCTYEHSFSDSTYYVAASGAGVWAAGTMGWVDALGSGLLHLGRTEATVRFVQTVTDNLLIDFARGPAGSRHRPQPNLGLVARDDRPSSRDDD